VLVAAGGKVHLDRHLPAPAIGAELAVGPLPRLLPLLGWLGGQRPHLVVLADREGADVIAYPMTGSPPAREVSAQTAEWPTHKAGIGGWAAKRFDATVEESWERSAERVATLVDDVARQLEPAVVVGSGDERAISLLQAHLPAPLHERFVAVAGGGRHADGGGDEVSRRVAETVAAVAAHDEAEVLERFAEASGRGDGARDGVGDVVRALQQAQVDTLLIGRGWHWSDRTLGYGPVATQLATDPAELDAMGVQRHETAPLADVVLRAALGTEADVVVISDGADPAPRDGIGALLRFDPAAARRPRA
jgi:peptide subunit release factor 1 (eRF1)